MSHVFNNSFYIVLHEATINFLFWTSFFFFILFYLSTRFLSVLTLESSAIWSTSYLYTCFRVSGGWFWLFLVLFWMLWMLVTVHKMRNVPQASKITTTGTVFTEIFFDVSKEWVSSWSHVLSITKVKTLAKKLLAVRPEKRKGRKKRKKNWNDNCKALCVKLKRKKKHFAQYFKKLVMDSRYALNITGSLVI